MSKFVSVPNHLSIKGVRCDLINRRDGDAVLRYYDSAHNRVHEILTGDVKTTGPDFSWVAIRGNAYLSSVKVFTNGHRPRVGDTILVGTIHFEGTTPIARDCWPAPRRHRGVVVKVVNPSYGFVRSEDGIDAFAHVSEFKHGALLVLGYEVFFDAESGEKGYVAKKIRPSH